MFDLISYRLYRLRRLWLMTTLPLLAALFHVAKVVATPELYALVFIATLPLLHVVVYPGAWMETLSVACGGLFVILTTPSLDFSLPSEPRALWFALLLCGGMLVFCAVLFLIGSVVMRGPAVRRTLTTSAMSTSAAEDLKAGITLYPGRDDPYVTCSALNDKGLFRATLHIQPIASKNIRVEMEPLPDTAQAYTDEGMLEMDAFLTCKVEKSTPTEHQVTFHIGDDDVPGVVVYEFEAVDGGTRVTVTECSQHLSTFLFWGMWLEDYFADHLVSEIERVEGGRMISNRNRPLRQFSVDLASLMTPAPGPEKPGS